MASTGASCRLRGPQSMRGWTGSVAGSSTGRSTRRSPRPHRTRCVFPSPPAHVQRRQAGCVLACLWRCRSTPRRLAWRRGGTRRPPLRDRLDRPGAASLCLGLQAAGEATLGCDRRMVRLARVGGFSEMKKSLS